MVLLNTVLISCTPEPITTDNETHIIKIKNDCCGGGESIPPPLNP